MSPLHAPVVATMSGTCCCRSNRPRRCGTSCPFPRCHRRGMLCPLNRHLRVMPPPWVRGKESRERERTRVSGYRVRPCMSESSQMCTSDRAHPDRAVNGRLLRVVTSPHVHFATSKQGSKLDRCFLPLSAVACGAFCHHLYCGGLFASQDITRAVHGPVRSVRPHRAPNFQGPPI